MKIGLAFSAALAIAAHSEVFTLCLIAAWMMVGTYKLMKGIEK